MRALDQPWVRPALVRKCLVLWGTTVAGLAMIIGFAALVTHYSGLSDKLRASGGQVDGTVTRVRDDTSHTEGAVWVRYVVGDETYVEPVDVGADSVKYQAGGVVKVYFDQTQPSTMTIDGEDNQPLPTVTPMVFLLVVGAFVLVAGLTGLGMWWRRRPLFQLPWQSVSVRVEIERSGRARSYVLHRKQSGAPIHLYGKLGHGGDQMHVLLLEQGRRVVVGLPERGRLRAGRIRKGDRRRPWTRGRAR